MSLYHSVDIGVRVPGNIFLAPMAGFSTPAFRTLETSLGADFTYTEMVSCEALVRGNPCSSLLLPTLRTVPTASVAPTEGACGLPNCTAYGKTDAGMLGDAAPYAVQLFGRESLPEAAKIVMGAGVVDINLGCPVPKVQRSGGGCELTRDLSLLYDIVHGIKAFAPVTVKMRLGFSEEEMNYKEVARTCIEAGVSAITLHPRTKAQGYSGKARWEYIKELVALSSVPVIASGDIFTPEACRDCLQYTGCEAVMVARGCVKNPFIFREIKELLATAHYTPSTVKERLRFAQAELHLALAMENKSEEAVCKEFRKKALSYAPKSLRPSLSHCSTKRQYEEVLAPYI